ncbi:phage baseplate assembly protein V [uncultured Herbaspirillum sp.]|uniref:phage baseplate assembly protein V n=1 Tax=uncultured Herbaspirillum sp. TaxID=160236 RepID=UPI00260A0CDE|nr:phage baseplate assembly protein V [uncultured Herbaspirillum sp.]
MSPSETKKLIATALLGVRQALRGKLSRVNAGGAVMKVQAEGLRGEPFNDTPYLQHPGFRSIPLGGNQITIVPQHGKSANAVVVAMSNGAAFVADLAPGEVAIFNENDGIANSVVLRNGKIAEITCDVLKIKATTSVEIDTPKVNMTHELNVAEKTTTASFSSTSTAAGANHFAGAVKSDGDVVAGNISLQNHKTTGVKHGDEISDGPQ